MLNKGYRNTSNTVLQSKSEKVFELQMTYKEITLLHDATL